MSSTTSISEKAISRIVERAAASVPGTATAGGGLERFAGLDWPRYDVELDEATQSVAVQASIAVTWPAPVTDVAVAVRETITQWIVDMTGLTVTHVNVIVGPIVEGSERVTQDRVENAPKAPRITPVRTHVRQEAVAPQQDNLHGFAPTSQVFEPEVNRDDRSVEIRNTRNVSEVAVETHRNVREVPIETHRDVREIPVKARKLEVLYDVKTPKPQQPFAPKQPKPAQPFEPEQPAPREAREVSAPTRPQLFEPQAPKKLSAYEPKTPKQRKAYEPQARKLSAIEPSVRRKATAVEPKTTRKFRAIEPVVVPNRHRKGVARGTR